MVELLIDRGANVNEIGPDGATAFHFACDLGFEKCGVALINAGCATHLKDDDGQTAQKVAIQNGDRKLVMALADACEAYENRPLKIAEGQRIEPPAGFKGKAAA